MPDLLTLNDRQGAYPGSYYAATAPETPGYPALEGDAECDVCIIGAGYCGLSAALHLAEAGFNVRLIDAQRVGWGASGRNGGQLGTGQRVDQQALEKLVGPAHARQLWEVAEGSKALVKSLVSKHNIECDLKPGIIYTDHKRRFVEETKAYVEHLNQAYGYDEISFLDRQQTMDAVGTDVYFGGSLDWGAGHLHPLNFALGLARAAVAAGAEIHENTRATEVKYGKKHQVLTESGTLSSEHVLFACNGYLGALEPEIASRVLPINSYIIATEPLGETRARSIIRDDVAVADSRFVVNYYRFSADHRMLFGGRESYGYKYPDDIATAVRQRMLGIYPQLEDVKVDYHWGGTLGITLNRMPHFARVAPNALTASGFSGHGLGMATYSGYLMAEAVKGDASGFDVMEKVPTHRFPGGTTLRQPLLVLAMLYYALRDRF